MKKGTFFCLSCLTAIAAIIYLPSCNKSDNTPPGIMFVSTPPYVYDDTTLPQGIVFSVQLSVAKAGVDQLLDTAFFSKSVNGGPDSVFQRISSLAAPYFVQYYSYKAGDSGNVEKYTFTFGQTNGLMSSKSITIKDSI